MSLDYLILLLFLFLLVFVLHTFHDTVSNITVRQINVIVVVVVAKKQAGRELASITGSDHRDPIDDSLLNPYNDSSLLRKQMKAGSLANFCPRSEFLEVNSREKLLEMDRDYSSKEDTSAGDGNFEIEGNSVCITLHGTSCSNVGYVNYIYVVHKDFTRTCCIYLNKHRP